MPRDRDVINISDLEEDELRDHLRRLSDLTSCPCTTCRAICDRYETISSCDAYQLWYKERLARRAERQRRRTR